MATKKDILINRFTRTIAYLLLTILCSFLLYLCSQIPKTEIEMESLHKGSRTISLHATDAGRFSSFFKLHDLSKAEYTIHCPKANINKDILFISAQDTLQSIVSNMSWSISKIDGGTTPFSKDLVCVLLQKDRIKFYVKNFFAENRQMVRNFFLTEVILFLLAMFGKNAYKLLTDIFNERKWINYRIWGVESSKKTMLFYVTLSFISIVLIFIVNRVPENHITTDSYVKERYSSFLSPYDISCAYQNIKIPASNRNSQKIEWEYNEIVEFVPNEFSTLNSEVGPKSVSFYDVPVNKDFEIKFFTRFLQSGNYQEIRLFVLTTLLLFFLERSWFYFRKWLRNKRRPFRQGNIPFQTNQNKRKNQSP